MTIDIGPNLTWLAHVVVGMLIGLIVSQPVVAYINARAAVEVARIDAQAGR